MTDRTLKNKIRAYNDLHSQITTLTEQADKLKDEIKAELLTRSVDEYNAGSVAVRCKEVTSYPL